MSITGLVGSLCAAAIAFGGGLVQAGFVLAGMSSIFLGVMTLVFLMAFIQHQPATGGTGPGLATPGLTVRQMLAYVRENNVDQDTKVYVGDQGINVAGGVFNCRLDGQRALVIERVVDEAADYEFFA